MVIKLLHTLTYPKFMEHVVLSKAQRKEKVVKGVRVPNRSAGKPRLKKIRGQDFYVGMDHNLRSKMIKSMKQYLYEQIARIPPIDTYPLLIEFEVKDVVGGWDLGNFCWIWRKCFEDALCGNVEFNTEVVTTSKGQEKKVHTPDRVKYPAKIEDDSVKFVVQYREVFTPIRSHEEREMIFRIYQIVNDDL